MSTVKIDGKDYELETLSDEAKAQMNMLNLTDQEIQRLNVLLAIAQTARIHYGRALQEELQKVTVS